MENIIKTWDLQNKSVFLRIDGNVPLVNGAIQNDFRLQAVLPTIKLLHSMGSHITIATHLGRPKNVNSKYSTKPLVAWFAQQGYGAEQNVTILENLRFDPAEQNHEKNQSMQFAQMLAEGMDYYVNDAWGVLHRNDASITVLPKLFAPDKRSIGLLIEKELAALDKLKNNPPKPYLIFLGGGKVETKLPIIEQLINKQLPTTIVLLPAIVFTFLQALGKPVGKSLIDESLVEQAGIILAKAKQQGIEIIFPLDYVCAQDNWDGPLEVYQANAITNNSLGVTIGPKSLELFKTKIAQAKTIFYNGAMGNPQRPETLEPLHTLLRAMAMSSAYTVVGGGNSIAEVEQLGLSQKISYCSTGGGSTLSYISNEKLPGLQALA